ncbi:hypothetical protein GDO86_001572 [Hymenochirus boettgeri]|uniref:Low density lipoprotein receptor-related protein 10 n=1 Tax=Hymenochirus boettgeri TaxID=247094 RepID=A0A8T2KFB0_9PIPI|nr:hypothetical protein GDO86_001572 [Hymenochirus boettgeri]
MSLLTAIYLSGCLIFTEGNSIHDSSFCPPNFFSCRSNCIPLSSRCDGVYDCEDQSDEFGCPFRCSFILRDFFGVFSPPGYPGSLASPLPASCHWFIDSGDSRGLILHFSSLQLTGSDTLVVYEWAVGGSTYFLRALDQQSNGKSVIVESVGGRVMVVFHYNSDNLSPISPVTHDTELKSSSSVDYVSSKPIKHESRKSDILGSSSFGNHISSSAFHGIWLPAFRPRGFNATYRVPGYCLPWDHPCGSSPGVLWDDDVEEGGGCFTEAQRCDGSWDCANGRDEMNCSGCPFGHYPCGSKGHACYPLNERCNYQTSCQDGTDEKGCRACQPGGFHCDLERCVYEAWVCDGQADCRDGSDERGCGYTLPRKVIAAAVIGSLICATLLVVALGCTCRLYTTRAREYSIFAPLSRMDAEFIQQQAPPSYGQLIAQGAIPPVDDFPTESPSDGSFMGNLRSLLQFLHQTPPVPVGAANDLPPRRRPPRTVRRLLRRLRRWGLLPPRAQGPSTEVSQNQTSSLPEGETESTEYSSAPVLPVKMPLETPDSSSLQAEAPVLSHSVSGWGLMGMMQAVRGRALHPLLEEQSGGRRGREMPEEEAGSELQRHEEEDEMLLMPLAEGWDSEADVSLIVC